LPPDFRHPVRPPRSNPDGSATTCWAAVAGSAENGIAVFSEREIERLAEALGEAA
jgi:hypothetical protein